MRTLILCIMVLLSSVIGWLMGWLLSWLLSWDIAMLGILFFIYSAATDKDGYSGVLMTHGVIPSIIVTTISVFVNGTPTLDNSEIMELVSMYRGVNK